VALYHEGIGKPEHRVETLSSLELSTNGVYQIEMSKIVLLFLS